MTEGLKAFVVRKVSYGSEQKEMIIKAVLNMFSGYCVAKGDEAVRNAQATSLINAALSCVASPIYFRIFDRQLQLTHNGERLSSRSELFLNVCLKYVINYKRAHRESMFAETKHLVVETASGILPQFIQQIDQIPSYLIKVSKD